MHFQREDGQVAGALGADGIRPEVVVLDLAHDDDLCSHRHPIPRAPGLEPTSVVAARGSR